MRVLSAASSHLGTNHFAPKSCNIWAVLSKSSARVQWCLVNVHKAGIVYWALRKPEFPAREIPSHKTWIQKAFQQTVCHHRETLEAHTFQVISSYAFQWPLPKEPDSSWSRLSSARPGQWRHDFTTSASFSLSGKAETSHLSSSCLIKAWIRWLVCDAGLFDQLFSTVWRTSSHTTISVAKERVECVWVCHLPRLLGFLGLLLLCKQLLNGCLVCLRLNGFELEHRVQYPQIIHWFIYHHLPCWNGREGCSQLQTKPNGFHICLIVSHGDWRWGHCKSTEALVLLCGHVASLNQSVGLLSLLPGATGWYYLRVFTEIPTTFFSEEV